MGAEHFSIASLNSLTFHVYDIIACFELIGGLCACHKHCHPSGSVAATNLLPSQSPNANLQEATPPAAPAATPTAAAAPPTAKQEPTIDMVYTRTHTNFHSDKVFLSQYLSLLIGSQYVKKTYIRKSLRNFLKW